MSKLINQVNKYLTDKHHTKWSQLDTDLYRLLNISKLTPDRVENLSKDLLNLNLLSNGKVNPKTAKEVAGFEFDNYILHLSPADLSGTNVCPSASAGCKAACLNSAGRGRFDAVQFARLRKTLYYVHFKKQFLSHLDTEIGKAVKRANGKKVAMRLNGTSDIPFELLKVRDDKSLIELYPNVTFYDYTKIIKRLEMLHAKPISNYSLTFSASESNHSHVEKALTLGFNVAKVFSDIPTNWLGIECIDGDKHDFRFLDKTNTTGLYVALKAKGLAKKDTSGFVTQCKGN